MDDEYKKDRKEWVDKAFETFLDMVTHCENVISYLHVETFVLAQGTPVQIHQAKDATTKALDKAILGIQHQSAVWEERVKVE